MVMLTFVEVYERLKSMDEVALLELLGVTSEDLVTAFKDLIEENYESLINEVQWEEDE